jgi:hypothetical protein
MHVSVFLYRDCLLNSYKKWGTRVRADLKTQLEHMELLPHLYECQLQIQQINNLVADFEISLAIDSWRVIWGLISEVQT